MIEDTEKNSTTEPATEVPIERAPVKPQATSSFPSLEFVEAGIGFHSGPQKRSGLKLALWTWLSAGIDTLVLVSMSCFFMMIFSILMQSPARNVVSSFIRQPELANLFVGSFLICFWLYLISMRLFMGASLGEWTCQLRLGQPAQRSRISYVFKVIARTTLVLFTGVIVLPMLSLLFKRDLVGDIIGIKIYSLK